ncbi:MAG: elongation factor G [Clostridia bacterium]|nr:elongation factor G [Clostridia bacterium]
MNYLETNKIRNVVLLGKGGAGKTSLGEAMLFVSKATDRLGKIAEGNTVSDYDSEEIKRKCSVSASLLPVMWKNSKINIIDTPGFFDFEGEAVQGIRAAEAAIICVSGKSGIGVATDRAFNLTKRIAMPRAFFINKLDDPNADFFKVLAQLKEKYGSHVVAMQIPIIENRELKGVYNVVEMKAYVTDAKGNRTEIEVSDEIKSKAEECRNEINEAVAGASEELMDKFFGGGEFTKEETLKGLLHELVAGSIYPVLCGSAFSLCGVSAALDIIEGFFPSPAEKPESAANPDKEEHMVDYDEGKPFSGYVFKTIADPFVGKMSFIKVVTGALTPDTQMVNFRTGEAEKVGKMFYIRGKKQVDAEKVGAGDIAVITKLSATLTGDTLCAPGNLLEYRKIAYPNPCLSMAVLPKAKGDEEKISSGLSKLKDEDLTFSLVNNTETHQMVISGLGETHIDVLVSKLKNKFGTEVLLEAPRVPYRETIKKKVKVQGKHKKQSGGHGQYGDVWIEFQPNPESEEMVFDEAVFGGAVPKNFFPAVEKGLRECMQKGVLAGYPVVNVKATLVDGSYHDVDSSEMSFKIAASIAFKEGISQAMPVILEPIGNLKVSVPDSIMGDVIGDINKRRGRVLGMTPFEDGMQIVEAEVPMAEMATYAIDLRSMSQGASSFVLKFERYSEAPANVCQAVIEEAKALQQ